MEGAGIKATHISNFSISSSSTSQPSRFSLRSFVTSILFRSDQFCPSRFFDRVTVLCSSQFTHHQQHPAHHGFRTVQRRVRQEHRLLQLCRRSVSRRASCWVVDLEFTCFPPDALVAILSPHSHPTLHLVKTQRLILK